MIHAAAQRIFELAAGTAAVGQGGPSQTDVVRVVMWIGLVIALLVVGGAAIMWMRKRMFGGESQVDAAGSLFDELRKAHREGLMTQEEYDLARKKLAARASEAMDRRAERKSGEQPKGRYDPRPPQTRPPGRPHGKQFEK